MGDLEPLGRRRLKVNVDRPAWVDDGYLAGVADHVGRAAQVAVQHLAEEQVLVPFQQSQQDDCTWYRRRSEDRQWCEKRLLLTGFSGCARGRAQTFHARI